MTGDKETAEHHHRYKHYAGTWVTSVFKLMSRMQTRMQVLIAACILRMVSSVPTLAMREQRPSKYKAQMFDCRVPGIIQGLLSEKCSKESSKGGKGKLSRNPVLNPKSKPVVFELGKIEPAVRKPEFQELIGSWWYKKRYDEMLKDEGNRRGEETQEIIRQRKLPVMSLDIRIL